MCVVSMQGDLSASPSGVEEVVLLTLVVRADARRQGVGAALLAALLQHTHQQQQQQQQGQVVCVGRIVADVALANTQAWAFFTKAGFKQGAASGATAEAVLQLDAPQQQQQHQQQSPQEILAGGATRSVPPSSTAAAALQANWRGCWLASAHPGLTPPHSGRRDCRQQQQEPQQLSSTLHGPGGLHSRLPRRMLRPVLLLRPLLHISSCRSTHALTGARCC